MRSKAYCKVCEGRSLWDLEYVEWEDNDLDLLVSLGSDRVCRNCGARRVVYRVRHKEITGYTSQGTVSLCLI